MSEETVLDDFGTNKAHSNNQNPNRLFLRLEPIFTIAFIIGYLFMWNGLMEGYWIIFLSLSFISLLFSFGYFISANEQYTSKFSTSLRILTGGVLGVNVIGLLFRIMSWKYGYELSFVGVVSVSVCIYMVLRPNVFCHLWKSAIQLAIRFILWGGLCTFYHFN